MAPEMVELLSISVLLIESLSPIVYSVPLLSGALAAVCGSIIVITLDCSAFFYQWRVKPDNRCHGFPQ